MEEERQIKAAIRWKKWGVIALALLALGAGLFWWTHRPPKTIQYNGHMVEIKPDVPVSPYDPEGFRLDGRGRMTYEKNGVRAPLGIDVSYYQKEIDWKAVADDGIDFALIRAGYRGYNSGLLNQDVCFEANYTGAVEAGLAVGVYFFSQAVSVEEAVEEADFVLELLNGRPLDYPIIFDWETIPPSRDPRTFYVTEEEVTACALAFANRIEEAGYQPMLYFNPEMGYLAYDLSQLDHIPFWLARYENTPDFYYDYDLWQFTHQGTVAGVEGHADLNLDLRALK